MAGGAVGVVAGGAACPRAEPCAGACWLSFLARTSVQCARNVQAKAARAGRGSHCDEAAS